MKKVLFALLMLAGFSKAHAATCTTLSGSPSASVVQSALNSCGSGNTVQMVAGTTSVSSTTNIPCGVTLAGAPFTWTYPANSNTGSGQTTKFSGPVVGGWGFSYLDNCTSAGGIKNIEWNGNQPAAGGGGALYIGCSVQNVTVTDNWFHGAQANVTNGHDWDGQIRVECGSPSQSDTPNQFNITWNIFGASPNGTAASGDCGLVSGLFTYQGGNYDAVGGDCNGIGLHEAQVSNSTIANNIFRFVEQGLKFYECGGSSPTLCIYSNVLFQHNDVSFYHRIGLESQVSPSETTKYGITYDGNVFYNNVNSSFGSWGFSLANIGYTATTNNVMIENNPPYYSGGAGGGSYANCTSGYSPPYDCIPGAFEWWANLGTGALVQGYWFSGYAFGYNYPGNDWSIANNTFSGYYMHNYGTYINSAQSQPPPTKTNNIDAGVNSSIQTSAAPTISPNGGTFSGSQVVTITDNGFSGTSPLPNGNTGVWYTRDGSTPVPGSGTAVRCDSPCTFTITANTVVKAVGMWGALNQPFSYASVVDTTNSSNHFGFVPSAATAATFTTGTPTAATPVFTPNSGTFNPTQSWTVASSTSGAYICWATGGTVPVPNGSGGCSTGTLYTGAQTVSATTTINAVAGASGNTNSAEASVTYTLGTPTVATPSLTPTGQSFSGTLSITASDTTSGAAIYYTNDGSTPAGPGVNSTNIDTSLTGWTTCIIGSCAGGGSPGGSGTPTAHSQTISNSSPTGAPSGTSMLISQTANTSNTNALWTYKAPTTCDNCTTLNSSASVYLGSNSAMASAFEFDNFNFSVAANENYMAGHQYNQATGLWQVFNGATGSWVNTAVSTFISYSAWHTIAFSDTITTCSGSPGILFNSVTIDGTAHAINLCEPVATLPGGYTSAVGTQFQIDIGTITGSQTVTENLDNVVFSASSSSTLYTAPIPVASTMTIKAIGILSGLANSAVVSATYTYLTPTISSCVQGNTGSVNTLNVGDPAVQQQAIATYSDGTQRTLPDTFGNSAVWASTSPSVLLVTSTGQISCLAAGTGLFSSLSISPGGKGCSGWGWTCNSGATLSSITLATTGGVSSLAYGGTNQIVATCHYSDGSTTSCNTTDSHGNIAGTWTSSSSGVATVTSSGLATAVALGSTNITAVAGGMTSPSLPLAIVSQKNLTGVTLTNSGSVTSINIGGTIQFHAQCAYSNASTLECSTVNTYGDKVTSWGTSNAAVMTMGALGGGSPGLATGATAGSANAMAVVNSTVNATPYAVTVTSAAVTITGITLATTGGITTFLVGQNNQLIATCHYSDGSTTSCNTTDSHGNIAGTWTSTTPSHATVSGSGLAAGIAAGTTTFTAIAGGFTSPALPITVSAMPSGSFTLTIGGH